jgi:D-alanyl-D-alanine dipeptidase
MKKEVNYMTQITVPLPRERWANILIIENNDPLIVIPELKKTRLSTKGIMLRSKLITMLEHASEILPENYLLHVIEGVRSLEEQELRWDRCYKNIQLEFPTEDESFWQRQTGLLVARPAPLANHNCGGAVDVQLMYADNEEFVEMGTPPQSGAEHKKARMLSENITEAQQKNRTILRKTMEQAGFVWYPGEWWHCCYGDRMWAVYTNRTECCYGPIQGVKPEAGTVIDTESPTRFKLT